MTLIIRRALVSQHKLLKVEKKVCHSFHCTFLLHTTAASTHSTLVFLYLPRERKSSKKMPILKCAHKAKKIFGLNLPLTTNLQYQQMFIPKSPQQNFPPFFKNNMIENA